MDIQFSPPPAPAVIHCSMEIALLQLQLQLQLQILAELHRPEAHIWGDRRGQPIRSATGSELES